MTPVRYDTSGALGRVPIHPATATTVWEVA